MTAPGRVTWALESQRLTFRYRTATLYSLARSLNVRKAPSPETLEAHLLDSAGQYHLLMGLAAFWDR